MDEETCLLLLLPSGGALQDGGMVELMDEGRQFLLTVKTDETKEKKEEEDAGSKSFFCYLMELFHCRCVSRCLSF